MINELQIENQKYRSQLQRLELEVIRLQTEARRLREEKAEALDRLEKMTRAYIDLNKKRGTTPDPELLSRGHH